MYVILKTEKPVVKCDLQFSSFDRTFFVEYSKAFLSLFFEETSPIALDKSKYNANKD